MLPSVYTLGMNVKNKNTKEDQITMECAHNTSKKIGGQYQNKRTKK